MGQSSISSYFPRSLNEVNAQNNDFFSQENNDYTRLVEFQNTKDAYLNQNGRKTTISSHNKLCKRMMTIFDLDLGVLRDFESASQSVARSDSHSYPNKDYIRLVEFRNSLVKQNEWVKLHYRPIFHVTYMKLKTMISSHNNHNKLFKRIMIIFGLLNLNTLKMITGKTMGKPSLSSYFSRCLDEDDLLKQNGSNFIINNDYIRLVEFQNSKSDFPRSLSEEQLFDTKSLKLHYRSNSHVRYNNDYTRLVYLHCSPISHVPLVKVRRAVPDQVPYVKLRLKAIISSHNKVPYVKLRLKAIISSHNKDDYLKRNGSNFIIVRFPMFPTSLREVKAQNNDFKLISSNEMGQSSLSSDFPRSLHEVKAQNNDF
ncbi:hypothetical protein Sjap_020122 [Stephania japonica]|uniref:Uncharacterized protein n=1 Tax=Stephania japonica TaxID=461633 RepID=A0AAP0HVC3_9MAGN